MLRKIWDVAAKDLLQLSKDRMALLWMLALPLLLMSIFGSVFSISNTSSTIKATLPVVNQDGGPGSQALLSALRRVQVLKVVMHTDVAAEEKAVRNGDEVGLLIIPKGFSQALNNPTAGTARVTYYAVPGNNDTHATIARDSVQQVVQNFAWERATADAVAKAQMRATGKADPAMIGRLAAQAGQQVVSAPPVAIDAVNATGRTVNYADQTVPGYAIMFALFGLQAGAGTILDEKESGTFKRLLVAPLPPLVLLGGKALAQFIQSFVQLTLLFAIGDLLFKIDLGPSLPALLLLIVGTSLAATGLGLILVSFIRTQRQLRPITTLIVLASSAIGGSWFPVSLEPQWMQGIANLTINGWAMRGFNGLMIFGQDFAQVLPNVGALFIYALVCFGIAGRIFRFREA